MNTAGAVIDCNKGKVTFHVNGNEHTVHIPRKQPQVHSINSIGKVPSIIFGGFEFPQKVYPMFIAINMKSDIAFGAINNRPCSIQKGSSKNNRHTIILRNIKNNKVH